MCVMCNWIKLNIPYVFLLVFDKLILQHDYIVQLSSGETNVQEQKAQQSVASFFFFFFN